jgi:hypothetical protein
LSFICESPRAWLFGSRALSGNSGIIGTNSMISAIFRLAIDAGEIGFDVVSI